MEISKNNLVRIPNNISTEDYSRLLYGLTKTSKFEDGLWKVNNFHKLLLYCADFNLEGIGKCKYDLYNYQKTAVKELLDIDNGSLIVASCGAGKTLIAIDLYLELLSRNKIKGPGLIVVKSSLKVQWFHEVKKFSDLVPSILETSAKAKKKFDEQFNGDLLICNYETLNDEKVRDRLLAMKIEYIFADEVQYVKNYQAKRSKSLYKFNNVKYTFGATATPIQKNPRDIFGIFRFIKKDLFTNINKFDKRYVKKNSLGFIIGSRNEKELTDLISPNLIVRTKEEVSSHLPKLIVSQKYCNLGPKTQKVSDQLLEEIADLKAQQEAMMDRFKDIDEARKNEDFNKIDNLILMKQTFAQELAITDELLRFGDSNAGKEYVTNEKSQKIELFLDLVESILSEGEKVVVFSKYRSLQNILDMHLENRFKGIKICHINGMMDSEKRFEQVRLFNETNDYNIIIASNAGSEGINMHSAKYLIEMDIADSYLIQTQRHGRIERASSKHDSVFVYQLIAIGSYDEIALKVVDKKEKYHTNIIRKDSQ